MNHYIFTINDLEIGNNIMPVNEVANVLLASNRWLHTNKTNNIKKMKPGDNVLIYFAGRSRRYFYGAFEIASIVRKNPMYQPDCLTINSLFDLACKIRNIIVFDTPILLTEELRNSLSFITNKSNWGIFFMHSTKIISKNDYDLILGSQYKAT